MDVVTLGAALNGSKKYTDQVAQSLMGGVHYRGSVSYYANLPANPTEGDSYTVKYAGTSGSIADGTEYTWGYDTDSQTYAWISFSKDAYSKAETDALLSGKQATLSQAQLNAVNSGIDSTKVTQIETNKNNILLKANTSDVNTATTNLQAQIDNIVTPVTQDAEVQNARVGEDGTSYVSLKERLDTEYSQIHNDFESIVAVNNMVYNIPDFTITPNEGSRIHAISTGFDKPEVNKTYTFSTVITDVVPSSSDNNNLVFRCVYRDSTYEQVVGTIKAGKQSFTFTVQKPVYNFTFLISSSVSADTSLTLTNFKLELGETATDNPERYTAVDIVARNLANNNKNGITAVNTKDDLLSAIQSGGIIYIESDISTDTMLVFAKDCTIYGNGHTIIGDGLSDAVAKATNGNIIIRDCHFTDSSDSVFVFQGTSNVICYNCEFSRSSGNDGVSGKESASGYFYNCKFHDNYDEGISTHGASYCEVIGGEAYKNGFTLDTNTKGATSSFGGVHLGGGRMGKVISVHSHNNCTYGIALINFQDLTVTDKETCCNNVVENNLSAGIWCTACRDLLLSNNTIVNNGGDAIHFGLDSTYTPTVDLIKSDGYVCGNIIYSNQTDSIVIDPNAESADLHIQN